MQLSIFILVLFMFTAAGVANSKRFADGQEKQPKTTTTTSAILQDQDLKNDENSKCTEHKGRVASDFLLHVPCLLIRIMEYLKSCPVTTYLDTFLNIRCSEKCTSGSLKKDVNRVRERIVSSVKDSFELKHARLVSEARRLTQQLATSPANLTSNKNILGRVNKHAPMFECRTYAYALRQYLIENQKEYAIRIHMVGSGSGGGNKKLQLDASVPLDESSIERRVDELQCRPAIRTDQSIYHYFKYLVESFRSIIDDNPSQEEADKSEANSDNDFDTQLDEITKRGLVDSSNRIKLSTTDVAQMFYPYVEMTDRFKRVLASHSYLNYFMLNQASLFDKNAACGHVPGTSPSPVVASLSSSSLAPVSTVPNQSKKLFGGFFKSGRRKMKTTTTKNQQE